MPPVRLRSDPAGRSCPVWDENMMSAPPHEGGGAYQTLPTVLQSERAIFF